MRDAGEVRDGAPGREPEEREVDRDRDEDREDGERDPLDEVVGASHGLDTPLARLLLVHGRQADMLIELKGPCGVFTKPPSSC